MEPLKNGARAATPEELLCSLMPQIFGMLKQGKITFELGLNNLVSQRSVCKDNKKAVTMITGPMTTK